MTKRQTGHADREVERAILASGARASQGAYVTGLSSAWPIVRSWSHRWQLRSTGRGRPSPGRDIGGTVRPGSDMTWQRIATSVLPALIVTAGGVATLWVATLLVRRVDGLSAPPYDLAFFQQIIWNVGQGGRWVSSFHDGSFLGLHFSPILVVPALIERLVWPDVRVLSLIHAVTIGAFIPAAFLFLRAGFRPSRAAAPLAAALAIGLPIWGAMQDVILSDFHPEVAGVVLALLAGWAGLSGRRRALWMLAFLALATREDVAYAVIVIGVVIAARAPREMRRHGLALIGVAAVWGVMVFGVLMPLIRAGAPSDTSSYYAWLGGGWSVLTAPFTRTTAVVAALTSPAPWFVLAGMIVSLGGLPLLRPRWALLVLPPLVASMLSAHHWQAVLRLQYPVILVVPLLAASVFGGRRALAWIDRRRRRGRRPAGRLASLRPDRWLTRTAMVALALLVTIPAISGAWVQGSLPPFDRDDPAFQAPPGTIDRLMVIARDVPESALLVADEGLVAPLAGRRSIRRVAAAPMPPAGAYVLLDRDAWAATGDVAAVHRRVSLALASGDRPIISDDGRFVLWGPEPDGRAP